MPTEELFGHYMVFRIEAEQLEFHAAGGWDPTNVEFDEASSFTIVVSPYGDAVEETDKLSSDHEASFNPALFEDDAATQITSSMEMWEWAN